MLLLLYVETTAHTIHTNSYRSFKIHSKTIPFFEKAKKEGIEEEEEEKKRKMEGKKKKK